MGASGAWNGSSFINRNKYYLGMIFPNYQAGCIANLMQSIAEARGGELGLYAPLVGLDVGTLKSAKNVVLLVVDGLGYEFLSSHPDSCLYQHLHSKITTVAPPTTAAAVSTFLTGMAPQQHALTGWFTYFRELGSVVTVLPYMLRAGSPPLGELNKPAEQLLGLTPFFDRLNTESYSVMPAWLQPSEFNQMVTGRARFVPYEGYQHCFDEIAYLCKQPKEKYIYAYWAGFDALAHEHGVGSERVAKHFAELDSAFEQLLNRIAGTDTALLVCSDHGFIDAPVEKRLNIAEHPVLQDCLQVPLCGEPRLAYCYVRHDKRQQFENYVSQEMAHIADLHISQALIDKGLFGLGEPHPELSPRTGDYTLVMKDDYVLTGRLLGDRPLQMIGYHGGLSSAEVYVPLITALR